ncbi:hypothetical protein QUF80_24105, partial [Desulfococcaceae bacterium HSG8]|nr:hypothetical protein [Desulfococcaceae bacterium HSG8]
IMKQYVIDELRLKDYEKVKGYLDMNLGSSEMGGIYWFPIDETILTDVQKAHTECQPFYFAIELGEDRVTCEILVRTKNRVRCNCIAYATETQFNWFIRKIDTMLDELEIKI